MSTPRTHPLNVSYLVVGLVFLGVAASWALREAGVVDIAEVKWLFPMTLVVAGGIGLVAMAAKGLRRSDNQLEQDDAYNNYAAPEPHEGEDR